MFYRHISLRKIGLFLAIGLSVANAWAKITVTDDTGNTVSLDAPAKRIVSLAPGLTELLFSAGAGERIVGTVSFSDFPEAARRIPQVGSYARIDLEAVLARKPDLIIAWQSGNPAASIVRLRALGIPVYVVQLENIEGIAGTLERLAVLAGVMTAGKNEADRFRTRYEALKHRYGQRPRLRVFYQISEQPMLTISDKQFISSVIALCGGENVFGRLQGMAPVVSVEAVLAARPDIIIGSGMSNDERPAWLDHWKKWPQIPAVAGNHLYYIPPDLIHRQGTRILDGAQMLCEDLEKVRQTGGSRAGTLKQPN